MEVSATAAAAEVKRGQPIDFTIKIKNISTRTCARDIGADMQELQLRDGTTIIWSSDDCGANHGHDDRQFTPAWRSPTPAPGRVYAAVAATTQSTAPSPSRPIQRAIR
jgi:hypothetical protein